MDKTPAKLAVDICEAGLMLSVSPRTIQNYIRAKLLPAKKIGRRTVITVRALERFLRVDHESPTFKESDESLARLDHQTQPTVAGAPNGN
jgi:hypothetical protein